MKRFHTRSLRFKLLAYIATIFFVFLLLVLINNTIALREIQSKIYQVTKENLTTYQNRLNDSFSRAENYLINFTFDNGDIVIIDQHNMQSPQWFSSIYRVQKGFSAATAIHDMDGFFLYSLSGKTYVAETKSSIPTKESGKIKPVITELLETDTDFILKNKGNWFPLEIGGNHYLFRVIKINNSWLGAWVSTANALYPFAGKALSDQIFFSDASGQILSASAPIASLPLEQLTESGKYPTITLNSKKTLVVSCALDNGNLHLISLIPHKQFYMDVTKYIPILAATIVIVILMMLVAFFFINHTVIHPLLRLNHGLDSLKNGNLETKVSIEDASTEFQQVSGAFNDMVDEIKTLKIDVYEEKLLTQRINMQYLKLQIAPHFLINCISTAYQLAELDKPELSKTMLRDLSRHLRYTLSSGDVVSLEQEMTHVRNYIDLSSIRYPNGILLYEECPPETLDASVISVLIQSFIENTIKYEVMLGKTIAIHISTSLAQRNDVTLLCLTIWDSGGGFDSETLRGLQNIDEYIRTKSLKHIGIGNVYQRASLYYGAQHCRFSFSNRPQAGAQIDIEIPYIPFNPAKA